MLGTDHRMRVNYFLSWSRTNLKNGNALVNSARGVWALIESGSALTDINEARAIFDQVNEEQRELARARQKAWDQEPGPMSLQMSSRNRQVEV